MTAVTPGPTELGALSTVFVFTALATGGNLPHIFDGLAAAVDTSRQTVGTAITVDFTATTFKGHFHDVFSIAVAIVFSDEEGQTDDVITRWKVGQGQAFRIGPAV